MRIFLPTTLALAATAPAHGRIYSRLATPARDTTALDLLSEFFNTPVQNLHQVANSLLQPPKDSSRPSTRRATAETTSTASSPSYTVIEDQESGVVELLMELPGVLVEDINVELVDETWVHIHGVRRSPLATATTAQFDQTFQLDENVDPDGLEVTLSSGILRVTAPKKQKVIKPLAIRTVVAEKEEAVDAPAVKPDDPSSPDEKAESANDAPPADKEEVVDGMTITEDAPKEAA